MGSVHIFIFSTNFNHIFHIILNQCAPNVQVSKYIYIYIKVGLFRETFPIEPKPVEEWRILYHYILDSCSVVPVNEWRDIYYFVVVQDCCSSKGIPNHSSPTFLAALQWGKTRKMCYYLQNTLKFKKFQSLIFPQTAGGYFSGHRIYTYSGLHIAYGCLRQKMSIFFAGKTSTNQSSTKYFLEWVQVQSTVAITHMIQRIGCTWSLKINVFWYCFLPEWPKSEKKIFSKILGF